MGRANYIVRKAIVDAVRKMLSEERKLLLDELSEVICMMCGNDTPCYCKDDE